MKEENLFDMNVEEKRLKTFKKWIFKEPMLCTKEKMAAAGFYFIGTKHEPDLVRCFVCFKELDGWEENDDPWEEHKSHSKNCPFILLNKKEEELTYGDMRELELQRQIIGVTRSVDRVIKNFESKAEETRKILEEIG
ncbi:Baculoviral IAP repeat-containing protein 5.2 [Armadillidium vulgare]|nr:Baculoviral IAP repeat-containing protein 5.2 [Armadillidium vulgare]